MHSTVNTVRVAARYILLLYILLQLEWTDRGLFLSMFPRSLQGRLNSILEYMSNEDEFLSVGGIRALSKVLPCSIIILVLFPINLSCACSVSRGAAVHGGGDVCGFADWPHDFAEAGWGLVG